jgi:ribosome-binding factor A
MPHATFHLTPFMSRRTEQVASLVQRHLGSAMQELELPFLVTISKVEVTPDLKHAKVWITVLPSGEENEAQVLDILASNRYELQGRLLKELVMKNVPRAHFEIDHSQEYAAHINEILKKNDEERDQV